MRKPPARGGRRRGGEEVGGLIRLRYVSRIMPVLRPSSVSAIAFFPAPGRLADGSYIPRAHERRVSLQALEALCCWHHKPACHSPFRPVQACASSRFALHLTRSSSGKRLAGQRQTGGARKEMGTLGLDGLRLDARAKGHRLLHPAAPGRCLGGRGRQVCLDRCSPRCAPKSSLIPALWTES